ncbi:ECF transporter S component [Brevibacillus sp. SYSU BS000544]|uniref:ECF transporter S component n=1 Tax=Brevibacillus sp. SYSU BS000544 TaxID=3416443 RepID=UPI003CE5899C
MIQSFSHIKMISILAMFIALSFVGSMLKLPSPIGTVALDSFPAFVAAILVSPLAGAIVGFFGHILTSLNVGFPLSIPIHLFIALQMAGVSYVTGYVCRRVNLVLGLILGTFLNGVIVPAMFIPFEGFGTAFFLLMVLPLTVGSLVNFILSGFIVKAIKGKINV